MIDELIQDHTIPNRNTMNRDQVIELCAMFKETEELFKMLEQIAFLQKAKDELQNKNNL